MLPRNPPREIAKKRTGTLKLSPAIPSHRFLKAGRLDNARYLIFCLIHSRVKKGSSRYLLCAQSYDKHF